MARTNSYNNRLQPSEMKDVQSGQSTAAIDLLYYWNYTSPATSSTTNNGNLTNVQVNTQALGMLASNYYQTFAYDNVNRLTTAGDNGGYGWSQNFGYDQFGNMWLSSFAGIVTPNLTPSLQSKINAATNHVSLASGTAYDGNGNLTTYGSSTLTYDTNNMMIGVAGSATYAYDGLGQRVSKVYGGVTTAYVYDAFGNPAAEYSSAATSLPVCATCYLSWDHIGSTRLVTDQNATPVARHDFLPFGGEIIGAYASRPSLWGTTDYVDPKFTGQFRDTESGLDFFNSRYHAQAMGRLLSADPAQAGADAMNPQTWNGYAYTINSPLVFTDPDGMDPFDGGGDTGDPCIDDPFLCSSGGGGPGWPTQPIPPPPPPLPPILSSSGVPNTSGVYGSSFGNQYPCLSGTQLDLLKALLLSTASGAFGSQLSMGKPAPPKHPEVIGGAENVYVSNSNVPVSPNILKEATSPNPLYERGYKGQIFRPAPPGLPGPGRVIHIVFNPAESGQAIKDIKVHADIASPEDVWGIILHGLGDAWKAASSSTNQGGCPVKFL